MNIAALAQLDHERAAGQRLLVLTRGYGGGMAFSSGVPKKGPGPGAQASASAGAGTQRAGPVFRNLPM